MNGLLVVAAQEIRAGIRNRWVVATTLALAGLALSLALLGNAPVGAVGADALAIVVVSLASLTVFLVPLLALLLSFDSVVGEHERGTLLLLLAYPVARWQILLGKYLGQVAILALAIALGYGLTGGLLAALRPGTAAWGPFAAMVATSVLLGAAFVALGLLASAVVRERATAAGLAVGLWLGFVLLYDTALLGLLVADQGNLITAARLDVLLLLNPADVYRLLNLTGSEQVAELSGMGGLGQAGRIPAAVLVGALLAWTVGPLLAAAAAFRRRQP